MNNVDHLVPAPNRTASRSLAEHAFRLRLVVGRVGEMDLARWWNTNGQLGRLGVSVLPLSLPRTFRIEQARSVFVVARQRCRDLYRLPATATLWELPMEVEDGLEQRWERWIDDAHGWEPFFAELETCTPDLQRELL